MSLSLPVFRPLYSFLKILGLPVAWDISAGIVLFCETQHGREYLLIRYPSGHFDYARGHVEAGETKKEAALREVQEETGIEEVQFFDKEFHTKFFYVARGHERERRMSEKKGVIIFKEVYLYPGKVANQDVRLSHEHTEYVWLPYEAALEKVTFDNAKRILSETEAYL
jgi:8-oxo-dGTP pyrophosphatase MutT (NUDIX family)